MKTAYCPSDAPMENGMHQSLACVPVHVIDQHLFAYELLRAGVTHNGEEETWQMGGTKSMSGDAVLAVWVTMSGLPRLELEGQRLHAGSARGALMSVDL